MVSPPSLARSPYRFSIFEADPQTGELRKNGLRLKIQDQPFQVLLKLVARPGEIVTREDLKAALWPADTFVDFDNGLNMAVRRLREALSDDADRPIFIETIPRKGYRFIAPVQNGSQADANVRGMPRKLSFRSRAALLVAAAGLVIVGAVLAGRLWSSRSKVSPPAIEVMPLAGLAGIESDPAFSPDGNRVAFAVLSGGNSGIYTTMVGGGRPLQLTANPGDCCPKWSPDGRLIAFSRASRDEGLSIYVIPAMGGTTRRVSPAQIILPPGWRSARYVDWSPDGEFLAFSENRPENMHSSITLVALADSSMRRLTSPPSQEGDYGPAFSPDGSSVAFVRGIAPGVVEDLYIVPVAGGEPKRLTFDNAWTFGPPAWVPDGRSMVFSSARGGQPSLWRISISGGTPERVPGVGMMVANPTLSLIGNQLAFKQMNFRRNIRQRNLKDQKNREGLSAIVTSDKGAHTGRAQFSPDGKRIVFESDRMGYSDIWACDSDGSNCGQLTSLHGVAGAPRWSPDGETIAFEYRPNKHSEVYLLDVSSGTSRLLPTLPGADNGGPNWSRDGRSIYFYSDKGGGPFQIWKISVEGGSPIQVTQKGGVFATESIDGRFVYYSKFESAGIWRKPATGGDEIRVLDKPDGNVWWNWAVDRNGIYFVDFSRNPARTIDPQHEPRVKFYDFATGKQTDVCGTEKAYAHGLALSPDGGSILYTEWESMESSILLVKNFR